MAIRWGSQCVYNTRYHLVWVQKSQKWVLQGEVREQVCELLLDIARHIGFEIEELELDMDHGHLLLIFPPKYFRASGGDSAVSARETHAALPGVRKWLWGGESGEDGYVARTVGDQVTAEVSKKYIRPHQAR